VSVSRIAVAACAAAIACAAAEPLPGFMPASAEERQALVRTIEDYYARRERASLAQDMRELFAAYPRLAEGEDRAVGINTDSFLVERMRISNMREISVEIERVEPVRVYVARGDETAVAFVHGVETWHYRDSYPGMGEFFTRIDLRRVGGKWTIERTDEQVMGEPRPRTPRP
jgi:hypothetical protein